MVSGPYWKGDKGTYSIQYWDGAWHRVIVYRMPPPWKSGDPKPNKQPVQVDREMMRLREIEDGARLLKGKGLPSDLKTFLAAYVRGQRNAYTRANLDATTGRFLKWCEANKIRSFDQIRKDVCQRWIAHLHETLKVSTIKTMKAQMGAAWTETCDTAEIKNPWKFKVKGKVENRERGSWKPDEFARLIAVCRPWLRAVLIFGVNTGLRINALIKLEWKDIDLAPMGADANRYGYIRVRAEIDKAKKGYSVPISPALHDLIVELDKTREGDIVLKGQHGRPIRGRGSTASAIILACARANPPLPPPDSPNHHMRRTFGRWTYDGATGAEKASLYALMKLMGHSSISMTQRYLGISEDDLNKYIVPKPPETDQPKP